MINPVKAAVIDPQWANRVISPPHDTLTPQMREQLAEENPDSFLHVVGTPTVSKTHPSGHQSAAVRAAAALKRLINEGAYAQQTEPMFFVQRTEALGRVQNSLIGSVDFEQHQLLPHEDTHDARVVGLMASFKEMAEMWSPVVAACPTVFGIKSAINAVQLNGEQLLHTETADGATITIWGSSPTDPGARSELKVMNRTMRYGGPFYIIDGHHRVAAAQRTGFERVLVALVPPDELILAGFDRLISDIDVMPRRVFNTLSQYCEITEVADEGAAIPTSQGWLGIGMDGHWYRARRLDKPNAGDAGAGNAGAGDASAGNAGAGNAVLDADFVHAQLLPALFGINDSSDPRISYRPSLLATRPAANPTATSPDVASPTGANPAGASPTATSPAGASPTGANPTAASPVAPSEQHSPADVFTILTAPVPVETVFATASQGETMPPKSTYLVPKARSGVILVSANNE